MDRVRSPKYDAHRDLESRVMEMAHDSLHTCVLAAGVVYGSGEDILQDLFRVAWLGQTLSIPQVNGENRLPLTYAPDLAEAIFAFFSIDDAANCGIYGVAVDADQPTIKEVASTICSHFQDGKRNTNVASGGFARHDGHRREMGSLNKRSSIQRR